MDKTFTGGLTFINGVVLTTISTTINFLFWGDISPICVALGQRHALFNCAEHHVGTAYFQGEAK